MHLFAGLNDIDLWVIMPQLVTIFITTLIICTLGFIYQKKVKKMTADECPRGIVLVIELTIKAVEKIVVDILGPKYKNVTVYLLYLFGYILIGNWLSVIGLESQSSMYTVTFSMAIVTFIGIYVVSIKFQKWSFFKRFINPLELVTQIAPLISLSFRLFGNILGGSIILSLLYSLTGFIWSHVPIFGQINLLIGVVAPFLHMYFDLFEGSIQGIIFGILTIVYWKLPIEEAHHQQKDKKDIKKNREDRSIEQALDFDSRKEMVPLAKDQN